VEAASRSFALLLAAACCALAAWGQEPARAARSTGAADCGLPHAERESRMAQLAQSRAALDQESARLAAETEAMESARRRAQAAGPAEVEAFNARRAEHARRIADHNERVSELNAQVERFNAESDAAATRCSQALRLTGPAEPVLDADERAALAAALASRLGPGMSQVMLERHTATFLCSRSLPDLIQFDGCSGMRRHGESAQEVIAKLRRAWPDASPAALDDLAAKGDMRARVGEPLAISPRQELRGYGEGASPGVDASIKVSRVGFDASRREAVAFVAARSRKRADSFAEYVHLRRDNGRWTVVGRMPIP
jgi:hypothetical protein